MIIWKMVEFVSWDDDIPNIWKFIKIMFQTTNQLLDVYLNLSHVQTTNQQ